MRLSILVRRAQVFRGFWKEIRCGGYRSEILQSRLSSRITTKPISAPLSVSPTVPCQAIKGARGSAKFRCANGSVQFAVAGGGNPLRAWFFLRNLGQQHPIANTTGPANSCAHGGRKDPNGRTEAEPGAGNQRGREAEAQGRRGSAAEEPLAASVWKQGEIEARCRYGHAAAPKSIVRRLASWTLAFSLHLS